jgi:hypothetical protein
MSISSKRHAKSYQTKSEWERRALAAEAEVERLRADEPRCPLCEAAVTHDPETCTRVHLQDRMAKLREALIAYDKLSLVIESAVRERRDRDSREEGNYELLLRVISQARAALRGGE